MACGDFRYCNICGVDIPLGRDLCDVCGSPYEILGSSRLSEPSVQKIFGDVFGKGISPTGFTNEKSLNQLYDEIIDTTEKISRKRSDLDIVEERREREKKELVDFHQSILTISNSCGTCGGMMVKIRGRFPKAPRRYGCPTCMADRLDMISEIAWPTYGRTCQATDT